ncbi:carboxypeptidase-like regulatory domain-containing protein [Lutibacter sp. HS1-25]|uniref:carboxypeptidase-like regulatory domain-containing protein n=1 Tax=Lutibacter sp. HS1-25 TaxID=2485000 RepID=UPI001011E547|nr:carboxypeptidase-like regulatory domain-containing protein [Lutibacter sp. HS1-25]RXP63644.1 carboxypeptidase-like regulatory domain-containing protein [Lutibacter sp. HS1-25]
MLKQITILLIFLISSIKIHSQTEIRGIVLDAQNKMSLPYTNIILKAQNRGVISNENGDYILNLSNVKKTDSVWFQYIGYTTKKLTVNDLILNSTIQLQQDVFAMNEVLILKLVDDPKQIIKKVLENKDKNYRIASPHKNQIFIRSQYNTNLPKFNIDFEKSNIEGLDTEMIENFEKNIPKQSTSYTDFLGYLYVDKNNDELEIKIDPIKTVALKEKDIAELDKIEKLFDSLFKSTGEKEYWKIKSGLFGQKLEISEDLKNDTIEKDTWKLTNFNKHVNRKLSYTSFEEKKQWEFLHKPNNYNYSIKGLTHIHGEDVYIIDFTPQKNGKYEGRLYIAAASYALIRADYNYAPNKIGKDFNLLGIGFTETEFSGSIYFEKTNSIYELKYFSTKYITEVILDRKFSLQKKQSKILFDKNLNEIKAKFNMTAHNEAILSYLVIKNDEITKSTFNNFKEKEKMKIIYVDQFDENLWKDYDIIEPTKQMKTYKKLN